MCNLLFSDATASITSVSITFSVYVDVSSGGSRIFLRGAPTPKMGLFFQLFAENCMKMKEFGPPGGRASLAPPLDPPMVSFYLK